MALIYCLLENRDLFVLDEWASEQDGLQKLLLYPVLPVLKAQGKTIIAVPMMISISGMLTVYWNLIMVS